MGVPVFIKIVETQFFDFNNVAVSSTMATRVIRGLDGSRFSKFTLVVRAEGINIGTAAKLEVEVYPAWPLAADPTSNYEAASRAGGVELNSTTAGGTLYTAALTAQLGPAFDVVITATKPAGAAVNCNATLSIGLLVWE